MEKSVDDGACRGLIGDEFTHLPAADCGHDSGAILVAAHDPGLFGLKLFHPKLGEALSKSSCAVIIAPLSSLQTDH
jgi:hypothetical protein